VTARSSRACASAVSGGTPCSRRIAAIGSSHLAELPSLIAEIDSGAIRIVAREMQLSQIETAWLMPDVPGERLVTTAKEVRILQ
jgi:hypothetical protein